MLSTKLVRLKQSGDHGDATDNNPLHDITSKRRPAPPCFDRGIRTSLASRPNARMCAGEDQRSQDRVFPLSSPRAAERSGSKKLNLSISLPRQGEASTGSYL